MLVALGSWHSGGHTAIKNLARVEYYGSLSAVSSELRIITGLHKGVQHNKFQLPSRDEDDKAAVKISFTPTLALSPECSSYFLLYIFSYIRARWCT